MLTELVVRNPGTSAPLRIPLSLECNVTLDKVMANVNANSRRIKNWVKTVEPHDRIAIVCGGGPSLSDALGRVEFHHHNGADVFALNGSATFLALNGIRPHYQVIMDAQPETASLIGPADCHLLASQVDPACIDMAANVLLWHVTYGDVIIDEQPGFPEHDDAYCVIGSSVSVGNTSLALLYALGYRTVHVFGLDSSYRGDAHHAFSQPMNDNEPCTVIDIDGQEYTASLCMAQQARMFCQRAAQLEAGGMKIEVHGEGLLPMMWQRRHEPKTAESERKKYERMWSHPAYREWSPGQTALEDALRWLELLPGERVIDFGCGTARVANELREMGHDVLAIDHVDAREHDVPFLQANLWELANVYGHAGICCDVMEHIPTERVDEVLRAIANSVPRCFFTISHEVDTMGGLIGQDLHLTVKSPEWWLQKLLEHWRSVQHVGEGQFYVSNDKEYAC